MTQSKHCVTFPIATVLLSNCSFDLARFLFLSLPVYVKYIHPSRLILNSDLVLIIEVCTFAFLILSIMFRVTYLGCKQHPTSKGKLRTPNYKARVWISCIKLSLLLPAGGQHDLHQLLPAVPRDAAGEAAVEGRGHPHAPLDLHQVLPGAPMGLHPHRTHLLHLRRRRNAGETKWETLYRVTILDSYNLPLTRIGNVPSTCLGSR